MEWVDEGCMDRFESALALVVVVALVVRVVRVVPVRVDLVDGEWVRG